MKDSRESRLHLQVCLNGQSAKSLHQNLKGTMNSTFTDEITLAEQAENLGRMALLMGLIPSFVVRHFPDSWEFYIPDETTPQLTPEEAYLRLKQLVDPT